jgi:hypothetical protein
VFLEYLDKNIGQEEYFHKNIKKLRRKFNIFQEEIRILRKKNNVTDTTNNHLYNNIWRKACF